MLSVHTHDVHSYFAPFARRSNMPAVCAKSDNRVYLVVVAIENVTVSRLGAKLINNWMSELH